MEFISHSVSDTEKFAQQLLPQLKPGQILALSGNLGAGKTVLAKALAKALNITETVNSPTFVLMKVYNVSNNKVKKFIHVDCYRLDQSEDLADIGLQDYLDDPDSLIVIEWAEKIKNLPADRTVKININSQGGDQRQIEVIGLDQNK